MAIYTKKEYQIATNVNILEYLQAAENNNRAIAYLQKREIDEELIERCMEEGLLYESKNFHNVVFVDQRDKNGNVQYANLIRKVL